MGRTFPGFHIEIKQLSEGLRRHSLVYIYFAFLTACLFLGDGKSSVIDLFGSCAVIVILLIASNYHQKQRELSLVQKAFWLLLIAYYLIRSIFSDNISRSIYTTSRFIEAYLIYKIFYCYSFRNSVSVARRALIAFSQVALLFAAVYGLLPSLARQLPTMNQLTINFNHNHIVDILTIVYPVVLLLWAKSGKLYYLVVSLVFIISSVISMARMAVFYEIILLFLVSIYVYFGHFESKIKKKSILLFLILATGFLAILNLIKPTLFISSKPGFIENRTRYWTQALTAIKKRPLFGSGPGTFFIYSKKYQENPSTYSIYAHSFILEQFEEVGIVGVILILALLSYETVRIYRGLSRYTNSTDTKLLLLAAGSAFAYGQFDYSFNYLVIWWLFWGILGIGASGFSQRSAIASVKSGKTSPFSDMSRIASGVTAVAVLYICIFYLFIIITEIILRTQNNVDSLFAVTPFHEDTVSLMIQQHVKDNRNFTNTQLYLIERFHSYNLSIMMDLADALSRQEEFSKANKYYIQSLKLEPVNTAYHRKYLDFLILNNNKELISDELAILKTVFCPQCMIYSGEREHLHNSDVQSVFSGPLFESSFTTEGIDYFSLVYYRVGSAVLTKNPEAAKWFLEVSVAANPGWSHIYLDYASMLKYYYKQSDKAKIVLNKCLQNKHAAGFCKEFSVSTLPPNSLIEKNKSFYNNL